MRPTSLAEAARATGGSLEGAADPSSLITGVTIDSRAVVPGDLFVALNGENSDGHDYAEAALAAGATAVLASRPIAGPHVLVPDVTDALADLARGALTELRAAGNVTVIALTGSVGKTTTKDLLAAILSRHGATVAPAGSLNNHWGVPLTVLRADAHTRYLVIEMGANHLGEITHLTSIAPPDISIVLTVGAAHLGEFGSIEAVARAKSELVSGTRPGGTVILNADNPATAAMAPLAPGPVLTFGAGADAGLRYTDVSLDDDGRLTLSVTAPSATPEWPLTRLQTGLTGAHHAANVAAACATAARLGIDATSVVQALNGIGPASPHRMAIIDRPDAVRVIDDSYNSNPDSLGAALRALARYRGQGRRTIAVIGEMLELGQGSQEAHRAQGQLAASLGIDLLIAVGNGAAPVVDGAHRGGVSTSARIVGDNDEATWLLADELRPGDVVLIKGSKASGTWQVADALASAAAESDG